MFGLIPKEERFFELFKNAAHNMIEGSRLLKDIGIFDFVSNDATELCLLPASH